MTTPLKYPARSHARKVYSHIKAPFFISGEDLVLYKYCDQTKPFRQNRYFFYLTGCNIPGSHVLYTHDKLVLYLPDVDHEDIMWSGLPLSPEQALAKYDVDEVKFAADIESDLKNLGTVYTTDTSHPHLKPYLTESDPAFFLPSTSPV